MAVPQAIVDATQVENKPVIHKLSGEAIATLARALINHITWENEAEPKRGVESIVAANYEYIVEKCLDSIKIPNWAEVNNLTGKEGYDYNSLPHRGYFIQGFKLAFLGRGDGLTITEFELLFKSDSSEPLVSYRSNGSNIIMPVSTCFTEPTVIVSSKDGHDPKQLTVRIAERIDDSLDNLNISVVLPTAEKEKREAKKRTRRKIKETLFSIARNLPEVFEMATRAVMRQFSEPGFDIVRGINRSKIFYITSELAKRGFVLEKDEEKDWKDGVLVYEEGSGNIYKANRLSRIKDGNVEYLDLFELIPANNTGLQRVYTETPWQFSTYQIIKEGRTPEQVLAEIKSLEKEHKDSIAQSISDDITLRDFNDTKEDDE